MASERYPKGHPKGGRFRPVPPSRRSSTYNRRIRSRGAAIKAEGGKPSLAELRGHEALKGEKNPGSWGLAPNKAKGRGGKGLDWYTVFEVHMRSGGTSVRSVHVGVNVSYAEVLKERQMYIDRGRDILLLEAGDYERKMQYTVGRFLGFRVLIRY